MDNSEIFQFLKQRRSVRKYSDACVSDEDIYELLKQATLAPSAGNCQDWHFTVVKNKQLREQLAEIVRLKVKEKVDLLQSSNIELAENFFSYSKYFSWFSLAPVLIAVTCRGVDSFQRDTFGKQPYAVSGSFISAAMAAQNFMLASAAKELSTCCLTGALIASDEIKNILKISNKRDLVCLLTLGYSTESPRMPERKSVDSICEIIE